MIRLIVRTVIALAANAVGLLVAASVLDGMELDATGFGMGTRSKRFSMIIDNGKLTQLNVEPPGQFGLSSADTILEQLK